MLLSSVIRSSPAAEHTSSHNQRLALKQRVRHTAHSSRVPHQHAAFSLLPFFLPAAACFAAAAAAATAAAAIGLLCFALLCFGGDRGGAGLDQALQASHSPSSPSRALSKLSKEAALKSSPQLEVQAALLRASAHQAISPTILHFYWFVCMIFQQSTLQRVPYNKLPNGFCELSEYFLTYSPY